MVARWTAVLRSEFVQQGLTLCAARRALGGALRGAPDALLLRLLRRGAAWSVLAACGACAATPGTDWRLLPSVVLTTEVALRVSLVASLLWHELAHVAAAVIGTLIGAACGALAASEARAAVAQAVTWHNLWGHVAPTTWAAALLPSACARAAGAALGGMPPLKRAPFVTWHLPERASPRARANAHAAVRVAGPLASLGAALAALAAHRSGALGHGPPATAAAAAPWLVLAAGAASDLLASAGAWAAGGVFWCGNFGCLLNLANAFVGSSVEYGPLILERMCGITQVRGGQAAGIACMLSADPSGEAAPAASRVSFTRNPLHPWDEEEGAGGAGGGAAAPPLLKSVRRRLVNTKRGDMPVALRKLYVAEAGARYPVKATGAAFIGHTRFATASLPAVMETHPHEWTPFAPARVWTYENGTFGQSTRPVGIHLTHNGDLDAVLLFHHEVPVGELGLWLERVLHCANSTRGDSPKGAGMMELLTCQGSWAAAVRYAYQDAVAKSVTEASGGVALSKTAPNTAPTRAWAAAWADVLDAAFSADQGLLAQPHAASAARFVVAGSVMPFVEAVLARLETLPPGAAAALGIAPKAPKGNTAKLVDKPPAAAVAAAAANGVALMPPLTLRKFLKRAAEAFMCHDVYEGLRVLLSRAAGSFGISVLSALEPDTVAVAAWGQQMSLALHERASMVLFGSEAAALKVPIRRKGEDPSAWEFMTHRLDLDETYGEVMRLSLRPRPAVTAAQLEAEAAAGGGQLAPDGAAAFRSAANMAGSSASAFVWNGLHVASYRMRLKRELAAAEITHRLVPLLNNPLVQPLPLLSGAAVNDPVGADIEAIPAVLSRVRAEWRHADSLCRLSATSFARMLLEKMALSAAHERRDVDLLVIGVETSLWIAEQWVADVSRAMPKVNAVAMSANKVTQMFGCDADIAPTGFALSSAAAAPRFRNAVVLVVSQSGQTFPGLHATRLMRHLVGNRVFVLTGEFDTKMGLVVGQDMARPDAANFCCRIFSNYSGWRPAEPTTVAAAAAHATLSELLLFMLHAYTLELSPDARAALLGLAMPRDDVRCLVELRDASTDDHVPTICLRADGKSVVGLSARAAAMNMLSDWTAGAMPGVHERLVRAGQDWASRVTESWHATVFSALYVWGTIWFQFAPMNVVSVVVGCGQPFYFICPIDAKCCVIGFALRLCDVIIYIWIGWAFLLLRRKLRGTDVFARRGKRVLVIADVPWVHQSLEIFVSKLFALAYGDNGLDVHGANPVDSLVHRFTHRVQRGVLIALGRPDGRLAALQRAEGACLLAAMQAAAIQNMGTGPEIVSVGHNTYRGNPGAIREHVVLPSNRRPFVCEYLAKAGAGAKMDETLSALGAGTTDKAAMLDGSVVCDRCASAVARLECVQCRSSLCRGCHMTVHLRGDTANRDHTPLPLRAAQLMRMSAARARQRIMERSGVTPEKDEEEPADEAAARLGDVSQLGAGAGSAFCEFGAAASATLLSPHGQMLTVSGAPMGVHHARHHLAGLAAARARARWRVACRVLICSNSPWKSLLLRVKTDLAQSDGTAVTPFAALYREVPQEGPKAVLDAEATMKDLYEGRWGSLERYIGFLVLFHAMALRVSSSSWPLPPWDLSRSQSILRVASTAAPISGAEVAHQLAGEAAPTAFDLPRPLCGLAASSGGGGGGGARRRSSALMNEVRASISLDAAPVDA